VDAARKMLLPVLDNQPVPARDIVSVNAGTTIHVERLGATPENGVKKAAEMLASGAARNKPEQIPQVSNEV
jgi:anthranilate phosphoribosyltransferase